MSDVAFGIDEALGFEYSEHLLVWAWRRIAAGRGHCPLIGGEFADACGEDAAEVLAAFRTFLLALAHASRRGLVIGHPGRLALTADERRVLTLIAAAQGDHPALFEAHLSWIARHDLRHVLAIGARALATALNANDLRLALPAPQAAMRCERRRHPHHFVLTVNSLPRPGSNDSGSER